MTEVETETPEVIGAMQDASLDPAALTARVDAVLGEDLYWFPVRHHSPSIARALEPLHPRPQTEDHFHRRPPQSAIDARIRRRFQNPSPHRHLFQL